MTRRPLSRLARSRAARYLAVALAIGFPLNAPLLGETTSPDSISILSGLICEGGSETFPVSITLPPDSIVDKVDVFFLFDDTGSFAGFVPTVTGIFSDLVTDLETAMPGVDFGFGVGRFEDYGGPGIGFSGEFEEGRPFTLNQPIVTAADAGGAPARNMLINDALIRTAPGFGGDGPETALEALAQVATGDGFDGNGNASTLDSGPAGDFTGTPNPQTDPGTSGDVPAFSSNVAPVSGTQGGVGWRVDALHLVILATDICPVSAFQLGLIPRTIMGAGSSSEPVSAFACSSTEPGNDRFGYVSDSKTSAGNTVLAAVAPVGSATVQETVTALNSLGIRVLGMGPGAAPTKDPGPSFFPNVFLSALARLTGAVDESGDALVFDTSGSGDDLRVAIVNAIETTASLPIDIGLTTSTLPPGLSFSYDPLQVYDVPPGGTADFEVTLTGDGSAINGAFDINFIDVNSSAVLGDVPVTIACSRNQAPVCTGATVDGPLWPPNHRMVPISILGVIDPDGDPVTIAPTYISQDEPVYDRGQGAGRTSPDASLSPLAVRAERNGNPRTPGNGRVYHISFTATDDSGASCTGQVAVCVPHDQRPGAGCVDDGPLYTSIP